MSPRLAFALEAAIRAGRSTLAHFRTGTSYERKSDDTPVTVADRGAERIFREMVAENYPREHVLGEEEGGDASIPDRWVVDPIDGTKSFVSGVPLYVTLVSYEVDKRPVLGVAYLPALNEIVYAEVGGGCFADGRPCRVSDGVELRDSILCCGGPGNMIARGRMDGFVTLSEKAMITRTWGDAYGHALVATGRAHAMIDPVVSRWDVSAMKVIVEEAGGSFSDLSGDDAFAVEPKEALSCIPSLRSALLEVYAR
jgi:histidinol-phosphatase